MSKKRDKPEESKITSEKPISLAPLDFEEALRGLLAVDPPKPDKKASEDEEKTPDS